MKDNIATMNDEQDGYALVSQLNELGEEFLKAKDLFEKQIENMKAAQI